MELRPESFQGQAEPQRPASALAAQERALQWQTLEELPGGRQPVVFEREGKQALQASRAQEALPLLGAGARHRIRGEIHARLALSGPA
jgi:hypothetical protein